MTAAIALIGIVLGAGPAATSASAVNVRVEFDAPLGCSDAQSFSDALSERSPSVHFAKPGEPATLLRVRLARVGNQVRGELAVVDAEGATDTRRVDGTSCDEVARGLSLTASLALDRLLPAHADASSPPDARAANGSDGGDASSAKNPSDASSADASKPPAPPKKEDTPRAPKPDDESGAKHAPPPSTAHQPLFVELGLEAALSNLITPKWDAGGGPLVRIQRGANGPSFGLQLLYLSNDALGSSPDLVVTWAGGALTACPARVALASSGWLEPCALFEGGRLSASDRSALRERTVARSWWSAGALGRAGLELGAHAALNFELGLSFPLLERRFVLENPREDVGHSPGASLLFGLGASYRL